jgi:hypothetical protein
MARAGEEINIGRPVEWMLDLQDPGQILGVTYLFSRSGERLTVWYTDDGLPAVDIRRVDRLDDSLAGKEPSYADPSPG